MKNLTKKEELIMKVIWELNIASVNQVIEKLPKPRPHYNTISTIIRILESKNFVSHKSSGRKYRYYASIPKNDYVMYMLKRIIRNYYGNSFENLLSHLIAIDKISYEKLKEVI